MRRLESIGGPLPDSLPRAPRESHVDAMEWPFAPPLSKVFG